MPLILDGIIARKQHERELSSFVSKLVRKPKLVIVQIGDDEGSNLYIKQKKKCGITVGIDVEHEKVNSDIVFDELKKIIEQKNTDESVSGIIVQLPIPAHLEKQKVIDLINPSKDVDGLTSINKDNFYADKEAFVPATARGIMSLLSFYNISVNGKKTAVFGRSDLVGRPTAKLLEKAGAKVTICHSQTENPKDIACASELLVVAIGKPNFIDNTYTNRDQAVVDVGINTTSGALLEEVPDRKLVGDVDFEKVAKNVSAISPVPGGVGPMTVISLFENVFSAECAKLVSRKSK